MILYILKGKMPFCFKMHKIIFTFKMYKIIFFPEKNVCLPYLKFSDLLIETHLYFYLALSYTPSFNP